MPPHYLKIAYAIVKAIAVLVMDYLHPGQEQPPQDALHH
jgi:hypothetical protein